MAILRVLLFVLGVSLVVSAFMAYQIAHPIVRLSNAANVVSRSVKDRKELPDFTHRADEIGTLSRSLRTMTDSLFNRLESIERFAADVAHELKNPLTSMRSAFEVMPYIEDEKAKQELRDTIRHDLDRMNRLITDISDASRADAEMAMEEREIIEAVPFLTRISETLHGLYHEEREVHVSFEPDANLAGKVLKVRGHEGRLGQVFTNLIENAVSFSPKNGTVHVKAQLDSDEKIRILVEDEGPGIPPEQIEKVFKRFYTDRPEGQGFGNNSGLGLNISEQIVQAHHGRIWAENIVDSEVEEEREGARFIVVLPLYFEDKKKKKRV